MRKKRKGNSGIGGNDIIWSKMKEYLVCGCFFLIFTMLLYALGKAVDIKEESYSVKFIKGYLVYSFFVAIGGMSVQLLHLKYRIFFAYMSVVLLLAVLKIIYSIKQENYIKIVTLKNFVKCNWFLIVLVYFLLLLSFANVAIIPQFMGKYCVISIFACLISCFTCDFIRQ